MKRGPSLNQQKMLRYVLQGMALGALATVVVFAFTLREGTMENLRKFPPAILPLLFGMIFLAWMCNGARVWLMCRAVGHPLRYRQAITVSLSTEFGIAATPAGVGGTVIRLTLLRQAGLPLTTAGSLLATDAAVDIVFFSLLAPFAFYFLLRDGLLKQLFHNPSDLDALLSLGVLAGVAAGVVVLLRTGWFHRLVARIAGATEFGRRRRLVARHRQLRISFRRNARRILTSLAFLWQNRKGALLLNFCSASVQWSCRYMILPVIILALGFKVNPLPLFLAQGILFAISLLVVVPGGGGSVEIITAVLLPNFVHPSIVGVVMLVWRFFTYHLYILGGGAIFFYACQRMHRLFPSRGPKDSEPPEELLTVQKAGDGS
jgi:glycosyltransferase 2 family protein